MFESNMLPALIALHPVVIVLLVILGVAIVALIVLSIVGRKMQKKQNESEAAMEQASQTASIVVIDKKRMKLKESGLPQIVLDQTPKYMRGTKVPVVKAKVGPKIMNLMCDQKVFDVLPVKREVKVKISGIYIMDIISARGKLEAPAKKPGRLEKLRNKAENVLKENEGQKADRKKKNK